MAKLSLALKVVSPVIVLVGCLHLVLGLNAEVLLGANIGQETVSDPVLDSQNRFYGVVFTAYGFLFYICASNLTKYQTILRTLLWVFFAAGCARLVSIVVHGMPSNYVLMLLATELIVSPIALAWLSMSLSEESKEGAI